MKFAFITGTSSGMGKAAANELLSRGWEVAGASRRESDISHSNFTHLKIDLRDLESFVPEITKKLKSKISDEKYERIALINNAASAGELLRLEELDQGKLQDIYTLNLIAPVWLTGFFYKHKLESSRLRIIDISSGAAHTALPGLAAYCGTKAALSMSGKVFAEENREDRNMAIMSYEPGTVDTEMQVQLKDQSPEKFPSYNLFKSFRDNNMLVKPEIVVKDIADFLEANTFGYSHKRFDPNQ